MQPLLCGLFLMFCVGDEIKSYITLPLSPQHNERKNNRTETVNVS